MSHNCTYTDEHCDKDQHDCQVDTNNCLEEEDLEVVCHVTHDVEKEGGDEGSEDDTEESATEGDFNDDATVDGVGEHGDVFDEVLSQLPRSKETEGVVNKANKVFRRFLHYEL